MDNKCEYAVLSCSLFTGSLAQLGPSRRQHPAFNLGTQYHMTGAARWEPKVILRRGTVSFQRQHLADDILLTA
uniref:(California timema) hypothetical protein n=1 Tax=Timema californicum TaxID=61474 RepID=A0A7R9JCW3_TIMCA|nr:unnamed protein product [Timema californicum]